MKIIEEFKAFAVKGNVIDLAVGIIIGAAFGKIVSSFVADVIMPPIGLLLGGLDFSSFSIILKESVDKAGKPVLVALNYGKFIQSIIDFLIIATSVFLMIKSINKLKRQKEDEPAPEPEPTKQEILLGEIRDLLKAK